MLKIIIKKKLMGLEKKRSYSTWAQPKKLGAGLSVQTMEGNLCFWKQTLFLQFFLVSPVEQNYEHAFFFRSLQGFVDFRQFIQYVLWENHHFVQTLFCDCPYPSSRKHGCDHLSEAGLSQPRSYWPVRLAERPLRTSWPWRPEGSIFSHEVKWLIVLQDLIPAFPKTKHSSGGEIWHNDQV